MITLSYLSPSPVSDSSTDAIPKKRGPKTDVLESLLKRVNGLEKRLKEDGDDTPSGTNSTSANQPSRSSVSPSSVQVGSTSDMPRPPQAAGKKRVHRASDNKIAISTSQSSESMRTKQEPQTPSLSSMQNNPNTRFQTPIRPLVCALERPT